MGSLQQRIASPIEKQLAAIATTAANLKTQFRELETLRDRVRKAQIGRGIARHPIRRISAARLAR
jgi:hypothetical protein